MADLDRLDALARAYDTEVHKIRQALQAFGAQMWAGLPDYRDDAIDILAAAVVPRVLAGQVQTAELTRAYLVECARELGLSTDVPPVNRQAVTTMRGVPPTRVYRRPGLTVWTALSQGKPVPAAVDAGRLRLEQLIGGDLQNAKRVQSRATMQASGGQYYRRVLTGRESCALCVVASTQRYHVKDLLPIHPGCDCSVGPLPPGMGMDQVIDEELLEAVHEAVAAATGASDRGARSPDYHDILVQTEHGEYGPVISFKGTRSSRRKALETRAAAAAPPGKPPRKPPTARPADEPEPRKGRVSVPEGLSVSPHEMLTAKTLADNGMHVRFRPLSHEPGVKNPDVDLDDGIWEFKAPKGSSEKNTISDQFKRAGKQAQRLVIDLRRCGLPDKIALAQIERRFNGQSKIIDLIVIDHNGAVTRHTKSGTL